MSLRYFLLAAVGFGAAVGFPTLAERAADVTIGGTHTGDGTFYTPGLGACGVFNSASDFIVAVGHDLFDNYPGYTGGNPNNNPVCGRSLTATYQGRSVTVKVEDRCVGCNTYDLDFSPAAFNVLADPSVGRIHGVQWHFN